METARPTVQTESCKGCGLCVLVCPQKILTIDEIYINKNGYHPVTQTNRKACTSCRSCICICPAAAVALA